MRNFIIALYDKNCDIFHHINETIVARYFVHSIVLWIQDISFLIMEKFLNFFLVIKYLNNKFKNYIKY